MYIYINFLSLLEMVERVFNKQAFAHSVETFRFFFLFFFVVAFFPLCPKICLKVNVDNPKQWTGLPLLQWKVQMDRTERSK